MYKRMLVPVSASAASMLGLREAVRFAKDQQARLRIVHIVDESALVQYPESVDITGKVLDSFVKDGEKTLRDAVAFANRLGIKAEHVLYKSVVGALTDVILKEAKNWRADVIVMGAHEQSKLEHFFLGSDAETIARSTHLPVLLIHAAAAASKRKTAVPPKRARA
ncbi:MAG TPA: universal stress protein [Burkholderiales bacterium]|jgi:nucleotide-binding universal stress UspA family protein|nr:universal stress protein [Burkholderiales bacterium]